MLDAYDREVAFTPDIVSTASSPTVSVALSPSDHLTIGGEHLKRNMYRSVRPAAAYNADNDANGMSAAKTAAAAATGSHRQLAASSGLKSGRCGTCCYSYQKYSVRLPWVALGEPVLACLSAVQTVTKRGVGGSSFVAGYKRILTPQDSIEVHAMLGESYFPDRGCTCAGRSQLVAAVS